MSDEGAAPLGAMRLIGDSFRLLFRHFGVFFPLALAPALLMEAVNIALMAEISPEAMEITAGALVASLLGALVGYLVIAVLCLATLDAVSGRRRGLDAYVSAAVPHILPLIVLGTVLSIAAGVALVFFIVPGLYVLAQFLVWVQAVVFEGAGLGALGRAQALTRGYRWPLVGAILVLGLLLTGGLLVAAPFFAVAGAEGARLVGALASGVVVAFVNALIAIFSTLVYLRLRELRDGTSREAIAAAVP